MLKKYILYLENKPVCISSNLQTAYLKAKEYIPTIKSLKEIDSLLGNRRETEIVLQDIPSVKLLCIVVS